MLIMTDFNLNGQPDWFAAYSELRAEVDVNNMSLKPMRKLFLIATEEL